MRPARMVMVWVSLLAFCGIAQAATSVRVTGEVGHPGVQVLGSSQRLVDATTAAQVNPGAYMLGALWSQQALMLPQRRLQAGLLYELGAVRDQALRGGNTTLATLSGNLRDGLQAMPVTGRRIVHTLDPAALAASDADNFPVDDGDALVYPARPATVRVVGAVAKPCEVPHVALKAPRDYVAACPTLMADRDLLYAIQPDGQVFELGIALWNRDAPISLAPGAIVYVPLDKRVIQGAVDAQFNRDMADFLATQPLDNAGVPP
ncbi:Capsule biosynthesis GfcC [Dyella sp. OK004]|uniref:capsule biosynthesis GfcC family protein n=1 Tax=Dyella sp. OK004 TaxID=1855292 RepID=UPI0008EEDF6E|nr:capsule biosynthesis GfcC family protein [Dyella sp. OK004]SFS08135.1 Capsule biosynthesis GfcC [Dyella sp. OK004]